MAQTNDPNTYIEPTPLWQDTHEVSQGLEHDTLVNLTHTCMCHDTYAYVSTRHFLVFSTQPCIQFKNQIHGKASLSMMNKSMKFGYNLTTFEKM